MDEDFAILEYGSYDDPLLMEGTGVTPMEDNNIWVRNLHDIYHNAPSSTAPDAVILAPATALQGGGKEDLTDATVASDASDANDAKDVTEEKLSPVEKTSLQSKIKVAEKSAVNGPLRVETLQVGKRQSNEQVTSALNEGGDGKKAAKRGKLTHRLNLE
jgi:hypothetical protein